MCDIDSDDYEPASVWRDTPRVARKAHECDGCGGIIPIGTRVRITQIVEQDIFDGGYLVDEEGNPLELRRMLAFVGRVGRVVEHRTEGCIGETLEDPLHVVRFRRRVRRGGVGAEVFWSEELRRARP